MEPEQRKHPSLPPNYVSILDLKKRWMEAREREREEREKQAESEAKPQGESVEEGDHIRGVPEKSEVAVSVVDGESTKIKVETEEVKGKEKNDYLRNRRKGKNGKARVRATPEEWKKVIKAEANAPYPAVVTEEKEKEKSGNANGNDRTVDVEEKLQDISIGNGGKGASGRVPKSPNNGSSYRGNNSNYRSGSGEHYGGNYRGQGNGHRGEGKNPSLPPNYVSILDLKKRWMEAREREREEQKDEEKQSESEARPQGESVEEGDRRVPVSVVDGESTEKKVGTEDVKEKEKEKKGYGRNRRKGRNGRVRARATPEEGKKVIKAEANAPSPAVVKEEEEKEKSDNANRNDRTVDLEEKLRDISINNGGKGASGGVPKRLSNGRSYRGNNSNYRGGFRGRYGGNYRRSDDGRRGKGKQTMVWLKKEEISGSSDTERNSVVQVC